MSARGGGQGPRRRLQYAVTGVNRWHWPYNYASGTTTGLNDGQAMAAPFDFDRDVTLDRAFCEVTAAGAAASVLRMAAYTPGPDGGPSGGALLGEFGTATGDAVAAKIITPGANVAVPAGPFFVWIVPQGGTPTLRAYRGHTFFGWNTANPGANPDVGVLCNPTSAAGGAVPGAFPAVAPNLTAVGTGVLVGVRVA